MSLEIDGHKYLGVHYPQPPSYNEPDENFHSGVLRFAKKEKPVSIMGDFNTPENVGCIAIGGYMDVLTDESTEHSTTCST